MHFYAIIVGKYMNISMYMYQLIFLNSFMHVHVQKFIKNLIYRYIVPVV